MEIRETAWVGDGRLLIVDRSRVQCAVPMWNAVMQKMVLMHHIGSENEEKVKP